MQPITTVDLNSQSDQQQQLPPNSIQGTISTDTSSNTLQQSSGNNTNVVSSAIASSSNNNNDSKDTILRAELTAEHIAITDTENGKSEKNDVLSDQTNNLVSITTTKNDRNGMLNNSANIAATSTVTAAPTNPPLPSNSTSTHHTMATPAPKIPTMSPIESITSRLLGLRGSPPGTLASIAESEIKLLCQRVRPILLSQPMLLELEAPLKICGDVHGQFTDLLRLFEYGGFPPESNYLFLGDYVDRGKQCLETICLLLSYKIQYPENFFILRGNHEAAGINRIYGFYDECKRRYSIKLWKIFSDTFNCLPVAALIDEKILCMHGGLSPEITSLQQIADLVRPCDVPDVGLMCDLLWSDPDTSVNGWAENDRGVSFVFGADVVANFLEKHDLDLIVRAHQVVEDGYEFFAGRRLVTLFSAPNYCGEFDNAGGMISVDENLMCSFQILKPSSRAARFASRVGGTGGNNSVTGNNSVNSDPSNNMSS